MTTLTGSALLALARKFIILDLHGTTAMELFGLAAATLALGATYWFVTQRGGSDQREARTARIGALELRLHATAAGMHQHRHTGLSQGLDGDHRGHRGGR